MSDTPDYPHVPASFINAIREEGTKEEACNWLQRQWNEACALRERVRAAEAELNDWRNGDLRGVMAHMEAFRVRAIAAEARIAELETLLSKNVNAELLDQQQAVQDRIAELTAALEAIAKQPRTGELDNEYEVECADFEGGYDACIDTARAVLAKGASHE